MEPNERDPPRVTAEDVFTPWEMEGQSRRDCEPHRAGLLSALAYGSLVVGGASLLLMVPALVGLPLGFATWRMACRDLDSMRAGLMDTRGFHQTEKARSNAHAGMILSLMGLLLCMSLIGLFLVTCS
jgi:hypothetical protein